MAKIKCKHCGAEIDANAIFCPECGKAYAFCPECGTTHSADAIVCSRCGHSFAADSFEIEEAVTVRSAEDTATVQPEAAPVIENTAAAQPAETAETVQPAQASAYVTIETEPEVKGRAIMDEYYKKTESIMKISRIAGFAFGGLTFAAFMIVVAVFYFNESFDRDLFMTSLFAIVFGIFGLAFVVAAIEQITDLVRMTRIRGQIKSGAVDFEGYVKNHLPIKRYSSVYGGLNGGTTGETAVCNKVFTAGWVSLNTRNLVLYFATFISLLLFIFAFFAMMIILFVLLPVIIVGALDGLAFIIAFFVIIFVLLPAPIVSMFVMIARVSKYSKSITNPPEMKK